MLQNDVSRVESSVHSLILSTAAATKQNGKRNTQSFSKLCGDLNCLGKPAGSLARHLRKRETSVLEPMPLARALQSHRWQVRRETLEIFGEVTSIFLLTSGSDMVIIRKVSLSRLNLLNMRHAMYNANV
jgi:hypothetical protein